MKVKATRKDTVPTLASQHPYVSTRPGETVETKYGRVRIRALGHSIMLDRGNNNELEPVTINGVEYHHSAHVDLDFTVHHTYLSRTDTFGLSYGTPAATTKYQEEVVRVAREWAQANPDELVEGDRVWRAQEAHTLARQLDESRADARLLAKNLRACKAGRPFQTYPIDRR